MLGEEVKQQTGSDGFTRIYQRPPVNYVDRSIPVPLVVVIADRRPAIRHDIRALLDHAGGFQVAGEAGTSTEVVAAVARHRPDVVVIDLDTDDPDEIAVIGVLLRVAPNTGVLVYSTFGDDRSVMSAIHAGARGYLTKNAGPDQILRAIHAVAAGEVIVGSTVAGRFSALLRQAAGRAYYPFPRLTGREREVLECIAAGKSNLTIARELALASKTVSNRVSAIFSKLGVADRAQAIVLARDAGLGQRQFPAVEEQFPYQRGTGKT